jgi:hypothetical protein
MSEQASALPNGWFERHDATARTHASGGGHRVDAAVRTHVEHSHPGLEERPEECAARSLERAVE